MKKLALTFFFLCFNYILFAQENFQVARLIKCYDEAENIPQSDIPNRRFMPHERELQRYMIDWVREGRLQAYTPQLADFSNALGTDDFNNLLLYNDEMFGEEFTLEAWELNTIGIEESVSYHPDKQSFDYQIQALVLYIPQVNSPISSIPEEMKGKAIARFRYEEVINLCNEAYQTSLQTGIYEKLDCFFQLYEDNTTQISFQEAFEQRRFQAEIM